MVCSGGSLLDGVDISVGRGQRAPPRRFLRVHRSAPRLERYIVQVVARTGHQYHAYVCLSLHYYRLNTRRNPCEYVISKWHCFPTISTKRNSLSANQPCEAKHSPTLQYFSLSRSLSCWLFVLAGENRSVRRLLTLIDAFQRSRMSRGTITRHRYVRVAIRSTLDVYCRIIWSNRISRDRVCVCVLFKPEIKLARCLGSIDQTSISENMIRTVRIEKQFFGYIPRCSVCSATNQVGIC